MPRPVDVLFDSKQSDNGNYDAPEFLLDPAITDVVAYSVVWASVPFSFYTIDRMHNEFKLHIVTNTNLQGFEGITWFNHMDSITCRINPGTYSPKTLSQELKRVLSTEPITKCTHVTGVPMTTLDQPGTSIKYPNTVGQRHIAGSYFNVEVDAATNRLVIWNTVLKPYAYPDNGIQNFFWIEMTDPVLAQMLGMDLTPTIAEVETQIIAKYFEPGSTSIYPDIVSVSDFGQLWSEGLIVTEDTVRGLPAEFNAQVAYWRGPRIVNLMGESRLNIHSSLAGESQAAVRMGNDRGDYVLQMPILSNYGSYIIYQPTLAEIPIKERKVMSRFNFYLTHGERRLYAKDVQGFDDEDYTVENYLPLNGEGFQVSVRFYVDDGTDGKARRT